MSNGRRCAVAAIAIACLARPASAMTVAEIAPWLAATTRVTVSARGPDPTISLRYVRVRGSDVAGYLAADFATHGFLANGQEILALPLASGGSMGVNAALLFTSVRGQRRFVGYVPSRNGHLSIAIREGHIETSTPIYGPGDPQCCPARHRIETFAIDGIRLVRLDAYVERSR